MKSRSTNPGTGAPIEIEEHVTQWKGSKQGAGKQRGLTYRCDRPN